MSDNEKSTDPGLSAAKGRELRGHEAQEAIADHEKTPGVNRPPIGDQTLKLIEFGWREVSSSESVSREVREQFRARN